MAEWRGRWGQLFASYSDALREESPRKGRSLSRSRSHPGITSRSLSRTRQGSYSAEAFAPEPESLSLPQTGLTKSGAVQWASGVRALAAEKSISSVRASPESQGIISWFGLASTTEGLKPDPRTRSKSPVYRVRSTSPKVTRNPAVGSSAPAAQRMLKLEVENLALRIRAGESEDDMDPDMAPVHVKHLRAVELDNDWLDSQIFEIENKVERRKLFAEIGREGASIAPGEVDESKGPGWAKRLSELAQELEDSKKRSSNIQDNFQSRAWALDKKLEQCLSQVNGQGTQAVSPADVQQETAHEAYRDLQEAVAWRGQLEAQLVELQNETSKIPFEVDTVNIVSSNPEVQQLHSEGVQILQQLDELKMEALRESQMYGSNRFQSMQQEIGRVSDEIHQNSQALQDERVCFESEVQELKNKARVLEDSLDSAKQQLYFWQEKAVQEQASLSPQPRSTLGTDVEKLRAEHASLSEELASLQREEEERKRKMEDLTTEMDVLLSQAMAASNAWQKQLE